MISIHALREEGDTFPAAGRAAACYFYPRPPRGGRHRAIVRDHECRGFLSTPSARRATRNSSRAFAPTLFLSTPSARRATLEQGHSQPPG